MKIRSRIKEVIKVIKIARIALATRIVIKNKARYPFDKLYCKMSNVFDE